MPLGVAVGVLLAVPLGVPLGEPLQSHCTAWSATGASLAIPLGDATWIYTFPGCVLALTRLNVCKDKNNKTIIAHWAFDFMDGNIVACIYVPAACLYKTTCKLGVRHLCKSVGEGEVQRGGTKDMGKRGTWNSGMQAQNGMSV